MEIALIHNNRIVLGPMGFNVRYINSELEDLELNERISPQSYNDLPIHFSDGLTHLVSLHKKTPSYDSRYYKVGDFNVEILKENELPVEVILNYSIVDKSLDEVKNSRKQEIPSIRKRMEDRLVNIDVNGRQINVSTSREERILLSSKLSSTSDTFNYKFNGDWMQVTTDEIKFILGEIDKVVQNAFDWEFLKMEEINSCTTIDQVYSVNLNVLTDSQSLLADPEKLGLDPSQIV